jgi:hypothetical protein
MAFGSHALTPAARSWTLRELAEIRAWRFMRAMLEEADCGQYPVRRVTSRAGEGGSAADRPGRPPMRLCMFDTYGPYR